MAIIFLHVQVPLGIDGYATGVEGQQETVTISESALPSLHPSQPLPPGEESGLSLMLYSKTH